MIFDISPAISIVYQFLIFFFYFPIAVARLCRQSESMPTLQLHISFKRNILGIFYKKSVSCVISRFYNFDIFE